MVFDPFDMLDATSKSKKRHDANSPFDMLAATNKSKKRHDVSRVSRSSKNSDGSKVSSQRHGGSKSKRSIIEVAGNRHFDLSNVESLAALMNSKAVPLRGMTFTDAEDDGVNDDPIQLESEISEDLEFKEESVGDTLERMRHAEAEQAERESTFRRTLSSSSKLFELLKKKKKDDSSTKGKANATFMRRSTSTAENLSKTGKRRKPRAVLGAGSPLGITLPAREENPMHAAASMPAESPLSIPKPQPPSLPSYALPPGGLKRSATFGGTFSGAEENPPQAHAPVPEIDALNLVPTPRPVLKAKEYFKRSATIDVTSSNMRQSTGTTPVGGLFHDHASQPLPGSQPYMDIAMPRRGSNSSAPSGNLKPALSRSRGELPLDTSMLQAEADPSFFKSNANATFARSAAPNGNMSRGKMMLPADSPLAIHLPPKEAAPPSSDSDEGWKSAAIRRSLSGDNIKKSATNLFQSKPKKQSHKGIPAGSPLAITLPSQKAGPPSAAGHEDVISEWDEAWKNGSSMKRTFSGENIKKAAASLFFSKPKQKSHKGMPADSPLGISLPSRKAGPPSANGIDDSDAMSVGSSASSKLRGKTSDSQSKHKKNFFLPRKPKAQDKSKRSGGFKRSATIGGSLSRAQSEALETIPADAPLQSVDDLEKLLAGFAAEFGGPGEGDDTSVCSADSKSSKGKKAKKRLKNVSKKIRSLTFGKKKEDKKLSAATFFGVSDSASELSEDSSVPVSDLNSDRLSDLGDLTRVKEEETNDLEEDKEEQSVEEESGPKGCLKVKTLQESLYKSRGSDAPNLIPKSRSKSSDGGSICSRTMLTSDEYLDGSLSEYLDEMKDGEGARTGVRRSGASADEAKLRWGNIEIREYAQCLSDNPACSDGAPIQLDWDYQLLEAQHVDKYEAGRTAKTAEKDDSSLKIPAAYRQFILLGLGYTPQQITMAVKLKQRDQKRRIQTVSRLKHMTLDEQLEKMSHIFPLKDLQAQVEAELAKRSLADSPAKGEPPAEAPIEAGDVEC